VWGVWGDEETTNYLIKYHYKINYTFSMTYIEQVYLPILKQMGVEVDVKLGAWGWYPQGGGVVNFLVSGGRRLAGINLVKRGDLQQVRGLAIATELAAHIPQRIANRTENLLREAGLKHTIKLVREKGVAPGAA
jgi:RNA 3'-terminal phosphate cyclase (ATP)